MIYRKTQKEFTQEILKSLGKGQRHAALWYREWMRKGKVSFDLFEEQSFSLLKKIQEETSVTLPLCIAEKREGNTHKYVFRLQDDLEIETVVISMKNSKTLCVSSQVGCLRGCAFCETGRMGLLRNLKAEEIVSQVFFAKIIQGHPIRNLVFMGMGEPLDNFEEVLQALHVLTDPKGMNIAPSFITVSTSGHVEGIKRLKLEAPAKIKLAVSLNAPNEAIRARIMPINKQWSMEALKEEMLTYSSEILVEYVLLKNINDSPYHATELAQFLKGMNIKLNLIPYNPQSRDRFSPPSVEVVNSFLAQMRNYGFPTFLRTPKGIKINGGCGQLGNLELRRLTQPR